MLSKTLAIGVINLFVVITFTPCITADDIEINNRSRDEYNESITYIFGLWVSLNWINKRGNYRGEANLTTMNGGRFKLSGYGWSNGNIVYFEEFATFTHASRFIGNSDMSAYGFQFVRGIAFGNIEWYDEQ